MVDVIFRRPYKIKLATPKFKRKRRQKKVSKPAPKKVDKVEEDIDWDAIKNIVGDIEDEA